MKLELISSRVLTDEEIREIEIKRRSDALLDEIRQAEIYRNRNNPAFSPNQLTRRRLLAIAAGVTGASVASDLLISPALATPLSELGQGASLIAKFISPQPILDSTVINAGETLSARAKLRSTVAYEQVNNTVGSVIYSRDKGVEDTKYFPHSMQPYTENEFSCDIEIPLSLFGYKIYLLKTKLSYIYRNFSVRT